jgi:hypothetical protein
VLIHGQEFTHLCRSLQSSRCEEVRFARDSPLEESGFEPLVPPNLRRRRFSEHLSGHCQINACRAEGAPGGIRDHAAETASRHWFAASARKIRSVERETRWR